MAAPSITVVDSTDKTVATWDNGTVQANYDSAILTILVWNNRGGSAAISDLCDVTVTALDVDGGTTTDVVTGKWLQVNCPTVDGNTSSYTAVGGSTVKQIRADGCSVADGYVIKGTVNDGNKNTVATQANYSTVNLRTHVPMNASPGTRNFKVRINGYYT